MLLKRTLCCVFGVMQCVYAVRGSKNALFSKNCTLLLVLYAPPSEKQRFSQSSSFWEARCVLIGQLSRVLWLAEHLKHVVEMLRPLPCCDAVSRCDKTKTIKPAINEAFIAFSEDIMTDYNDSYSPVMHCATMHRVNITPCLHLWS